MKKLSIMQAIKYSAFFGKQQVRSAVINRGYLTEAMSYMSRFSNNAREIVGAGKLIRIINMLEELHIRCADAGYPARSLLYEDKQYIRRIVREDVRLIEFIDIKQKGK